MLEDTLEAVRLEQSERGGVAVGPDHMGWWLCPLEPPGSV